MDHDGYSISSEGSLPTIVDIMELFQILKDDAVKVLHSICQQICKTQPWPQDWKRSVFIPIPKKGNAKECSNYGTIVLYYCGQESLRRNGIALIVNERV